VACFIHCCEYGLFSKYRQVADKISGYIINNPWANNTKQTPYQMSTIKSSCYIRFLNLIDALDRMNPGKKLDSTEESLLDKIVLSFHAKQAILVGDLISISDLGSQATLHGRLKNLSAMGYIKMAVNEDGRKKEVVPTKIALKRYEEISKCLEKAAKAS
jgi:DNA-binding MarR family transcriptional regulator